MNWDALSGVIDSISKIAATLTLLFLVISNNYNMKRLKSLEGQVAKLHFEQRLSELRSQLVKSSRPLLTDDELAQIFKKYGRQQP